MAYEEHVGGSDARVCVRKHAGLREYRLGRENAGWQSRALRSAQRLRGSGAVEVLGSQDECERRVGRRCCPSGCGARRTGSGTAMPRRPPARSRSRIGSTEPVRRSRLCSLPPGLARAHIALIAPFTAGYTRHPAPYRHPTHCCRLLGQRRLTDRAVLDRHSSTQIGDLVQPDEEIPYCGSTIFDTRPTLSSNVPRTIVPYSGALFRRW